MHAMMLITDCIAALVRPELLHMVGGVVVTGKPKRQFHHRGVLCAQSQHLTS
jgi:hypothetical protein